MNVGCWIWGLSGVTNMTSMRSANKKKRIKHNEAISRAGMVHGRCDCVCICASMAESSGAIVFDCACWISNTETHCSQGPTQTERKLW